MSLELVWLMFLFIAWGPDRSIDYLDLILESIEHIKENSEQYKVFNVLEVQWNFENA